MISRILSPFKTPRKWQRARLRRTMRGYRVLKQSGHIDRIALVKQTLTEHPLNLSGRDLSPTIFGQGIEFGETIVRQYLLLRVGEIDLNRALLMALGKNNGRVVYCIPKEWRDVLMQYGFEVAQVRSGIFWQLYVCATLLYGMAIIGKVLLAGLKPGNYANQERKRYVCFANLGSGNLPQLKNGRQSHDVISWYLQWKGKASGVEAVHHTVGKALPVQVGDVEVMSSRRLLPDLTGVKTILGYALWGMRASTVAARDWLRGRWWHALLLNQAALAAQVRALPADSLAKEYLFHNSGWMYRPLWTYEAGQRGSIISLYFYSTNCESFKRTEGYPPLLYGWKAMTWSRYLVWDEYQADFVRRAVGARANISIVGPIWFQSSATEMPRFDKSCVAVFDVTPHRASRYSTLGVDSEFYVPAVTNSFLEDVNSVTRQQGVLMLWKRKRKIGRIAHPQYRHLADQLAENDHVVLVDPDIAADRVIETCAAVVSMPYTSTALIARNMGKPSVYYDPTGQLQRDDRAAHGIPVLSGVDELEAWLSTQLAS